MEMQLKIAKSKERKQIEVKFKYREYFRHNYANDMMVNISNKKGSISCYPSITWRKNGRITLTIPTSAAKTFQVGEVVLVSLSFFHCNTRAKEPQDLVLNKLIERVNKLTPNEDKKSAIRKEKKRKEQTNKTFTEIFKIKKPIKVELPIVTKTDDFDSIRESEITVDYITEERTEQFKDLELRIINILSNRSYVSSYEIAYRLKITDESSRKILNKMILIDGNISFKKEGTFHERYFSYSLKK